MREKPFHADIEPPVAVLRARTLAIQTSASGVLASSIRRARRYSCRDRPVSAARAASSSLVSSGMSRIVIDLGIAAV